MTIPVSFHIPEVGTIKDHTFIHGCIFDDGTGNEPKLGQQAQARSAGPSSVSRPKLGQQAQARSAGKQ